MVFNMAWAPYAMMGASMLYDMYKNQNQDENWQSTYLPEQQKLIEQATSGVGAQGMPDITQNPQYKQQNDWLMSMFNDPEFFKSFEAPIMRQFQEQTLPQLTNRFAGMGTGGNFQSSAFQNQLGREGANLHEKIAALRGMMQQNAIPQLQQSAQMPSSNYQQLLNSVLSPQPNNVYQPPYSATASMAGPFSNWFMQNQSNNSTGMQNNNLSANPLGTYNPTSSMNPNQMMAGV